MEQLTLLFHPVPLKFSEDSCLQNSLIIFSAASGVSTTISDEIEFKIISTSFSLSKLPRTATALTSSSKFSLKSAGPEKYKCLLHMINITHEECFFYCVSHEHTLFVDRRAMLPHVCTQLLQLYPIVRECEYR